LHCIAAFGSLEKKGPNTYHWTAALLQVDGSALGQHMEDFYLATLKEAVLAADPALAGRVNSALQAAADKVAPASADSAAAAPAPTQR
jgi:hypothetical protein